MQKTEKNIRKNKNTRKVKNKLNKNILLIFDNNYDKETIYGDDLSKIIDQYDCVIRFDDFNINESKLGSKINYWILNENNFTNILKNNYETIINNKIIILLAPYYDKLSNPNELLENIKKITLKIIKDKSESHNKKPIIKIIPKKYSLYLQNNFDFNNYYPSTQLLTLIYFLNEFKNITIFGYDFKIVNANNIKEKEIIYNLYRKKKFKFLVESEVENLKDKIISKNNNISPIKLVNKIILSKTNENYRFGDIVFHYGWAPNYDEWKNSQENILNNSEFNNTILKEYIVKNNNNTIRPSDEEIGLIFNKIIENKIIEKKYTIPDNDELVIHIRLGDVETHAWFLTKPYIELIQKAIDNYNITKITFVTCFNYGNNTLNSTKEIIFNYTNKKHKKNIDKVVELFKNIISNFLNLNIDVKSSYDIDEDFVYMCKAKYFICDVGGFSSLIKIVQKSYGNCILIDDNLCKNKDNKPLILTVATHEDKYLQNYKTSFKINTSYEPVILGMNTKWRGFLDKFYHIQSYVRNLNADDIVCYTDSYDVLFASNLLPHIPNKLIVSGESNTMGGNISAPIPEIWKRQGNEYNKYINSGFVYGTAADVLKMMEWVLEYKNNVKYEGGLVYDMNKMRKTKWKDEWVSMTKEEYDTKTLMCEDDQVLLCLYANEFPERIYLDRDERYVTSIMENDNIDISTLTTQYGKPCVIHVPFMKHRLDFYEKIKNSVLKE